MAYDTIPMGAVIKDRYVIRRIIGKGGGGIVYEAYDQNLRINVVLKQMREDVASLLDSRAEVDILKQLKHERLPKVFDFFEYDGRLFTSMDYIRGRDLNSELKEKGRFLQGQVLEWAHHECFELVQRSVLVEAPVDLRKPLANPIQTLTYGVLVVKIGDEPEVVLFLELLTLACVVAQRSRSSSLSCRIDYFSDTLL